MMERIKIGISACVLGEEVRYDGSHKLSVLCKEELGRLMDFVPVCPEVGIGMGVPRKPIRLVGEAAAPRAVGVENPGLDVSEALREFGRRKAKELQDLSGYIFIRNSPSCGLFGVKVLGRDGIVREEGRGLFAEQFTRRHPLLPAEEAHRLEEEALRESFMTRALATHDWRRLGEQGLSVAALTGFQARYKYSLMARAPRPELGRLLAERGTLGTEELAGRYFAGLMRVLEKPASRGGHANVLMHLQGYLRPHLDAAQKRILGEAIEDYRRGGLALAVPRGLLAEHFLRHPHPHVMRQAYLWPFPDEPERTWPA